MKRSLLLVFVTALLAAGAVTATYGDPTGLATWMLLFPLGLGGVLFAHLCAKFRYRIITLGHQFMLSVAIVVTLMLVMVVATAEILFVSHHDAVVISIIIVFIGVVAVRAALLVSDSVLKEIRSIRDAVKSVEEGNLDVRINHYGKDELGELADAANTMFERLAAEKAARDVSEEARRRLVAGVSHDLRTPLASLRLLTDAIDDEIVDEETRSRYLQQMDTHIKALSSLIDDLFEMTRLEAGEINWERQDVDLRDLLGDTVEAMQASATDRGVQLIANEPDSVVLDQANSEKLQRVLFNLIQNAIKHTPKDGSIELITEYNDGSEMVEIEVRDSGSGIAREDRDHVFEAFFRGGNESARTSKGAGLGLAISRAIIEAHGGTIWLADSDSGARFRFNLPVVLSKITRF